MSPVVIAGVLSRGTLEESEAVKENAVTEAEGQRFEDITLLALKMQPGGHDSKDVGVLWDPERPWQWVQS